MASLCLTRGGFVTRIEPLFLPLAWLTHLGWSAGLQSLTSRRAIPAQVFEINLWNCLLLFNLIDIIQQVWGSSEVHLPLGQRCTASVDDIPGLCMGSIFSRVHLGVYFLPHGTQHCSDPFPPGNAELNQRGLHLEIPCLQHTRM